MADLLECVIQIKALADTPRRLAGRLHEARARAAFDAAPILGELLVYESWLRASIEAGLSGDEATAGAEPAPGTPLHPRLSHPGETALEEFSARRAAVVRRLDACSAAQLSKVVLVAGRGPTTVADLVALALAHDTDTIARIVKASRYS